MVYILNSLSILVGMWINRSIMSTKGIGAMVISNNLLGELIRPYHHLNVVDVGKRT